MKLMLSLGLLAVLISAAAATGSVRERKLLDFGWRFQLGNAADMTKDFGYGSGTGFAKAGEAAGASGPRFDDSAWRTVNLPHDWVDELDFVHVEDGLHIAHGSKPANRRFPDTAIGWYRKTFDVPQSDEGKRISVEFDGVFRDSIVWLNGHLIGRELSGYSSFRYDLTDFINYGGKNVLAVRVDASQYEGWFYEGGGIYRHVWLVKTAPLHVAHWGTYVVSEVEGKAATITIKTEVANESDAHATFKLSSAITGPKAEEVAEISTDGAEIGPWQTKELTQRIKIPDPKLWSLDAPNLYKLVSTISADGAVQDDYDTTFGIRTIRFDKDQGFFLNGKRVEIQGTCNHQDHAGVGSALPDRIQYFRIEKLKEMGCNAYRTSHNAPTPELLDACDKLGMLVMDENRLLDSSGEVLSQLSRQIRRDRNHPSVILWSIGNEEMEQGTPRGQRIATTMVRLVHTLDPTRPTTYAGNNGTQYEGVNSVVDVRGINYMTLGSTDAYHQAHPEQPMMGSEEASTLSTRGEYVNDPVKGYVSAYDVNKPDWGALAEEWWQHFVARPYLAGAFVWTGFDYRGEPTPYGWPCISSHFGILDTCGFPKDNFYYYQAWWSGRDVLHILPYWNWPGKEGQEIPVWVYSNLDEVELFLNGQSLGRKPMPRNGHLEWQVKYAPGTLEARGYHGGALAKTERVETTGPAAKIVLTPDRSTIDANGEDVSMVTVSTVDAQGRLVPVADNDISFDVQNGSILGVGNGDPSSHERDRFFGDVVSAPIGGWLTLPVSSEDFKAASQADWSAAKSIDVTSGADGMAPDTFAAYRATFNVSADQLGRPLQMSIGQIDDLGWIYVNGQKVAETNDWNASFSYDIASRVHEGANSVLIVVKNNAGRGGLGGGVRLTQAGSMPQVHRKVFHGLAQVIVQGGREPGQIHLKASAPGLEGAEVVIQAKPAPFRGY